MDFLKNKTIGEIISSYIDGLINSQNKDGGWGIEISFPSTPLNTSQVILSIKDCCHPKLHDIIEKAINYLRSVQSDSGGWPNLVASQKHIETITTTSHCIISLLTLGDKSDIERIERGITWIINSKNNNNLWSNTIETDTSITSSIFAIKALLMTQKNGIIVDMDINDSILEVAKMQNINGGIPFYEKNESMLAPSFLLYEILHNNSKTDAFKSLEANLIKYIENLDIKEDELIEFENKSIGTIKVQFQYVSAIYIIRVLFQTHLTNFTLRQKCLSFFKSLIGEVGFHSSLRGRIFSWSTAEATSALLSLSYNATFDKLINEYTVNLSIQSKIFLSHKGLDKPMVRRFRDALEATGFIPWLDEDIMVAGSELERGILDGIKQSCAVVFFITPNYKDVDYLATEIDYAIMEKRRKKERFSIITLSLPDHNGNTGEIPELLTRYVWKSPQSELEAFYHIIRALPIKLQSTTWKN